MYHSGSRSVPNDSNKLSGNLKFYQNKKRTKPEPGYFIKEILKWHGDYEMLERNASCIIQWLFPTKTQSSINRHSQPLQDHEALAIRSNNELLHRAYQAYNIMLDFYGMEPVLGHGNSFTVVRALNWEERYEALNRSRSDCHRITRILSSMGEMGFGQYQCIWLRFLLKEIIEHKTLCNLDGPNIHYWLDALASDIDQVQMVEFYTSLKSEHGSTESDIGPSTNIPVEWAEEMDYSEDSDSETEMDSYRYMNDINEMTATECVFREKGCCASDHTLQKMPNVRFYLNQIQSKPEPGFYLEELKSERIDCDLTVKMHMHIQWLFPTPDQSAINKESFPVTEAESFVFQNSKALKNRFIEVYRLMLACYGLDIVSNKTGEICKVDGWEERFHEIDRLSGLPRIITRILTCLGALGFVQFQIPLVYFLLKEAMKVGSLPNFDGPHVEHWIGVIVDHDERQIIAETWRAFQHNQQQEVPAEWDLPKIERTDGAKPDVTGSKEKHSSNKDWSEMYNPVTDEAEKIKHVPGNLERKLPVNEKSKTYAERFKEFLGIGTSYTAGIDDYHRLNANVEFYWNRKTSSFFWGHKIEDMLQWKGDYHKLEINHQYIQWLFPIPESRGMNPSAQPLQPHEAEEISQSPVLRRRVLRAFEMMLDFYGMELISEESTVLQRSKNWPERYHHLNRSGHNHLRITRILKSLGHLGLQAYQNPWVNFLLHEIFVEQTLPRLGGRQLLYWIESISDESEKQEVYMNYLTLKENCR